MDGAWNVAVRALMPQRSDREKETALDGIVQFLQKLDDRITRMENDKRIFMLLLGIIMDWHNVLKN